MGSTPRYYIEDPPQEGVTIRTTVYVPISRNHGTRILPEGSHKNRNRIVNQNLVINRNTPSLNTASTEVIERKGSSTSEDTLSLKPTFNVSLRKRYSKINLVTKNDVRKAPKGETLPKVRKPVDKNKVRTLISEKPDLEGTIGECKKLTCIKPDKSLTDLLQSSSSKNIECFKEDCHSIETVFLNCSRIDRESTMTNLNILGKLYQLVSCGGGIEWKPRERVVQYITHYLCNNPHLLSQLVYIITDSEDLQTCLFAIKILYQLLVKGDRFDEGDRLAMKTALSCPTILHTLIESMYFIDIRFVGDSQYKQELQKLHSQILQIIIMICKKDLPREQLSHASVGTVKLIGRLTSTCYKCKDLANVLLETLKILCLSRRNCKTLTSTKFFDGLYTFCNLTDKLVTIGNVLKAMSRSKSALHCMSENEKVFNLILDVIYYNGKKPICKQAFFTTLYRIIQTENGLKMFIDNEMFDKLYHYFVKGEKYNQRSEIVKAYTILNRVTTPKIFPNIKLNVDLRLPDDVKKCLEIDNLSEGSDSENDDSEEDSQDDGDDSDGFDTAKTDRVARTLYQHTEEEEEPLANMSPFYVEHLLSTGQTDCSNIYKFDMYEGILRLSNRKVLENRVHRGVYMDRLAYPDAVMSDPEFDEHILSSSVNSFSIKKLAQKMKRLKNSENDTYHRRVVYDLDQLQENLRQPMAVPHPSTYSYNPNKTDDRTHTNTGSLKFESRFECGNLRKAIQVEKYEYELQLSPDTNSTKGLQWFYFQVTNMVPRVPYTFNIINCLKFYSQYNYGMQPLMFSVIDHALNKTGWKRVGRELIYYGNNYINPSGSKQYKTLSFSVSFQHSSDYVYFAYHYPYTYTRLMIKLFPLIKHKTKQVYARIDKLCKTVNNKNEVALVTITGAWNRAGSLGIPLTRRPIIFITGRVHPGESNSSWIIEGIIKFLLHETDENAITAREHFIFKIIPMLNPEGVIYGNNRFGLTGADLNRCWIKPNKITCPEIYHAKRLIACAKKVLHLPIAAYIDVHGHSQQRFFFFYGCNPAMSWSEADKAKGDFDEILKILPEMVHNTNPNISLTQCKYKITKDREGTGRVVMWREFDIQHSFTLECSFSFANEIQSINTKILTNIGASVIASLGKIADKVYSSKKAIPSLLLDYVCIDNMRTNIAKPLKDKKADGEVITSFFNDQLSFDDSISGSES